MLAKSHHKKNYELSLNKFLGCLFMSHQQNAVQDNIQIAMKSFKNLVKFTYLEIKLTYQNYMLKEVKAKLSSGNSCYSYTQTVFLFAA
jgi:predicted peptidase